MASTPTLGSIYPISTQAFVRSVDSPTTTEKLKKVAKIVFPILLAGGIIAVGFCLLCQDPGLLKLLPPLSNRVRKDLGLGLVITGDLGLGVLAAAAYFGSQSNKSRSTQQEPRLPDLDIVMGGPPPRFQGYDDSILDNDEEFQPSSPKDPSNPDFHLKFLPPHLQSQYTLPLVDENDSDDDEDAIDGDFAFFATTLDEVTGVDNGSDRIQFD